MKNKMLYVFAIIMCIIGVTALYYFYPRRVSFELIKEIDKPSPEFDNYQFIGFEYVRSRDKLFYFMVEHYTNYYPKKQCYDSIIVEKIGKELDFQKYDYIITYQKRLLELRHSPYLTKTEDGLYYDKRIPLIPTWNSIQTDKVYIYRIKKNNKFRAPGP